MIRLSFLLTLCALFSCKCGEKAGGANTPLIRLETGPCFGFCPVFRLTVLHNGRARYEGIRFAEKLGADSIQLTRAETELLRKKIRQTNLWQYPERIPSNVVDAPHSTLTVFKDGAEKSVSGSIDRPAALLELETLIKDLAEAHDLQLKRGVNPNVPPSGSRAEVFVSLKPEVNAGNWIQQFSEFKFQLMRRLPVGGNAWMVAYDPKQIEENAVLELFKSSADVLDARPK